MKAHRSQKSLGTVTFDLTSDFQLLTSTGLGRLRGDQRSGGSEALSGNRVIPAMALGITLRALLLDVRELTARRQLAVPSDDAAARQCSKPQEPHVHGS